MGLLRDYFIKDKKTKMKVGIVMDIIVICIFILSLYTPQLNDVAHQQGWDFGNATCIADLDYIYNITQRINDTELIFKIVRDDDGIN